MTFASNLNQNEFKQYADKLWELLSRDYLQSKEIKEFSVDDVAAKIIGDKESRGILRDACKTYLRKKVHFGNSIWLTLLGVEEIDRNKKAKNSGVSYESS